MRAFVRVSAGSAGERVADESRSVANNCRVTATESTESTEPWAGRLVLNADGLVPAVAQDVVSGQVLMLAWMDEEALRRTWLTGRATYWSRSRQEYWVKGETSGNTQQVHEIRLDCDGDTVLLLVDQHGPACHTGSSTCFDTAPAFTPFNGERDRSEPDEAPLAGP